MLNSFLEKARVQFVEELMEEDFHWKIYRPSTHVDIILVGLSKYILKPIETLKIDLINACLKSLIVNELGETKIEGNSPDELNQILKSEKPLYIQTYDSITIELMEYDKQFDSTLFDEKNYLKMLSQLRLNDYPREVICQIFKLLTKN